MTKTATKHLSTTALARQMGKESKELFVLLANSGWILKVDDRWQLTEKGKFEGGIYVNHPKFGDYIAWPEAVQEHPLLRELPEAPLSASNLGLKLGLPARLVNLLLAERGWISRGVRGWLVTPAGRALGGQQQESDQSGVPFVTWPETLAAHPPLLSAAAQLRGQVEDPKSASLDGHAVNNKAERMIDNWLYVAGLVHARNRPMELTEPAPVADFYLPACSLCIEYWDPEAKPAALTAKLEKLASYQRFGQNYLEVRDSDLENLDEVLARALLRAGLAVY